MNVQEIREDETLSGSVIWSLFNRAHFAVYRLRELELAQFGLTVEQTGILILLLSRGGSATAKAIEDLTMRQHHSISTLINRMVKMNLVTKRKIPDRKTSEIVITKDGEDLYKSALTNSMEMVFSSLKAKNRKQLLEYLTLILEKARDLLGFSYVPPFLRYRQIEDRKQEINVNNKEEKKTTDQEIWRQLNLAWSGLYRLRELELAQFSLTVEQTGILNLLLHRGGLATAKMVRDLTMRQDHSISTLINRMVKMNLVTKRKSPDGKTSEIVITKDGEDLYKTVPSNSMEMAFSSLKAKDRKQLLEYLTLILEKARDLLGVSYIPPFLQYLQTQEKSKVP